MPTDPYLGRSIPHVSGALAVLSGSSNSQGQARYVQLVEGSRNYIDGVQGQQATNRVHVEYVSPHPQGERGVQRYIPCGGAMEGVVGGYQLADRGGSAVSQFPP